ncbi:hypothetical protein [Cellulomonas sp. NPDC089187]|uniref:hypothetical protein n=1 Tax=Cellulomonas sp. NPDC089187 TaxID=3154970 RepID=UPI00341C26AE
MDAKAKRILRSTYWKNGGWRPESEWVVSPEDFAYAQAQGVMFDPVFWTHDECVAAVQIHRRPEMAARVGAGLLASLSTRRLDWRSAAASWEIVRDLPDHPYQALESGQIRDGLDGPMRPTFTCAQCQAHAVIPMTAPCAVDRNVLNFERITWGGVRHQNLDYLRFDLDTFAAQPPSQPVADDRRLLTDLLDVVARIEPTATAGTLTRALRGIVPGPTAELRGLVEILAVAGVLRPQSMDRSVHSRSDWGSAAGQWRGSDGYDRNRVAELFDI